MDDILNKGLTAKRESKYVEFKESFDPSSPAEWCEIIKDIAALANSGGGVIVIGVDNVGTPTGVDVAPILAEDPATVTDKINKYTGYQFTEFEITECEKDGHTLAAIKIFPVQFPLVFQNPGQYAVGDGKQKTAFSRGTVYFRHGAKSEPGNTDDIRKTVERKLETIRREWLQGVRKVVKAPPGAQVNVMPPEIIQTTDRAAIPIRIVDDPSAPPYRVIDPDVSHPYRQKELIDKVNKGLPKGVKINAYDVLTVRRVHDIGSQKTFCHTPKFGTSQYSDTFVGWLLDCYRADNDFFVNARKTFYEKTH